MKDVFNPSWFSWFLLIRLACVRRLFGLLSKTRQKGEETEKTFSTLMSERACARTVSCKLKWCLGGMH